MSKLPIFIIFGSIIFIGGAFYFFGGERSIQPAPLLPSPSPTTSISPVESSTTMELSAGGSSYLDPTGLYNFLYPNDFVLDESDPKHPRIYKTGPTQKGQTEMYDGALIVFEAMVLGDESLEKWTDNYIKTVTNDGTSQVIEGKKQFLINNYQGFSFRLRGLGESQYYVLQKDSTSKNVVMITTAVHDPTNAGFQKQVDNTLATLKILK